MAKKGFGVPGAVKKCFGVAEVAKKSVLAWVEWQEKCFGMAGVAKKCFGVAGVE